MTTKTIKTILFAALIAAMILPFGGMQSVYAEHNEEHVPGGEPVVPIAKPGDSRGTPEGVPEVPVRIGVPEVPEEKPEVPRVGVEPVPIGVPEVPVDKPEVPRDPSVSEL